MSKLLRYTYIASFVSNSFIDYTFIIPSAFGLSSVLSTSLFCRYVHVYLAIFLTLSFPFFLSFSQKMWRALWKMSTPPFSHYDVSPDTRIILHQGSGKVTYLGCKYVRLWNALEICPVGGTLPSLYEVSEMCSMFETGYWVWRAKLCLSTGYYIALSPPGTKFGKLRVWLCDAQSSQNMMAHTGCAGPLVHSTTEQAKSGSTPTQSPLILSSFLRTLFSSFSCF